ncbi:MAG: hypothetical protein JSW54_00445 [Fidelibacterota bacterium]|nr:MAG: hypothetical protein JSW54_00445 [Candidatus Neomarinimicrobiota bacterium]
MQRYSNNIRRLVFLSSLVLASTLFGQLRSDLPQTTSSTQLKSIASPSWLNPQRFTMSHGVSFSFMTGNGFASGGTSLSVYTNQMRYLVADNLILNSRIHLVQPGMLGASQLGSNDLQVYYQAGLDWQVANNINIHVGFSNLPPLYRYSGWNRGWRSPYQRYRILNHSATTDQ